MRFRCVKETTDALNAKQKFLDNAIGNLTMTAVPKSENLIILHRVDVTMIDGKVATALSTANQMNQLHIVYSLPLTPTGLKYGLLTLHSWIC